MAHFEVLLGSQSCVRWVDAKGRLELSELNGAKPVEGGHEGDGGPLFIARGRYNGNVIPGKASAKLSGAFVPFDNTEKEIKAYVHLYFNPKKVTDRGFLIGVRGALLRLVDAKCIS